MRKIREIISYLYLFAFFFFYFISRIIKLTINTMKNNLIQYNILE